MKKDAAGFLSRLPHVTNVRQRGSGAYKQVAAGTTQVFARLTALLAETEIERGRVWWREAKCPCLPVDRAWGTISACKRGPVFR
jgi:hypothetical protein